MYPGTMLEATVESGEVQRFVPPSPPSPVLPLELPLLDPLLDPLASPPPLELLLPLLEPLLSSPASAVPPLLLLLAPVPPLLLLQPEANEKEAATVRIEVVMRMRRSMLVALPYSMLEP